MMRVRFAVPNTLITTVVILAWTLAASSQTNGALSVTAKPGEWRYLNADPQSTRYSPLDQITKDNFKHLKIAWRWKPAIGPAPSSLGGTAQSNGDPTLAIYKSEATPIMANGVLYESAGGQRAVAAIDAATGKQLWLWNGMDENGRDRKAPRRNAGRGVGYWTDGREERIFVITTGFYLVAPPSEIKENGTKGTWYNPGSLGGSLWQGGGFDPENNYFYIPSKTGPSVVTVANDPKSDLRFSRGPRPDLSLKGLPILKPPYSRITALDLNTGDYAWVVPLGTTPQSVAQNPVLAGLMLPNTGGIGLLATLLVTKTLLIAGEGWGGEPIVRAYDKKTGAVVAEVGIPGQMGSMPMTYMVNGKQYIAFTVGTPTEPAELVALVLE